MLFGNNQKNREAKQQQKAAVEKLLPELRQASQALKQLTSYDSGYFPNYPLQSWRVRYRGLYDKTKTFKINNLGLSTDQVAVCQQFLKEYPDIENIKRDYNARFREEELRNYSAFFDVVEGRKLDLQQRNAIITDEDNNIVIAGAGSGKTTTIVGKVNYVIQRYKVRPEEILLISFTKESANTLAGRVNIKGVEARTFHKFGMDTITQFDGKKPSIFPEEQFGPLLQRFFNEEMRNKPYMDMVTTYFTDLLKPYKSEFDFQDQGAYIQYIKDHNVKPYKLTLKTFNGTITYRMETVKSMEECRIANFLYFNGIEYEYEYPYEHQTATESYRQYKPDFRIKQGDKIIYLEHFALNKNGDVPSWFSGDEELSARDKYHKAIAWKRVLHSEHKTLLVETYSYEMQQGKLFDNLQEKLSGLGIKFTPKSSAEIWEIINHSAKDEVRTVIELFGTFITLLKSNNYTFKDLFDKNKATHRAERQRNHTLLEIIKPLYLRYQDHLHQRQEIDFSDMINLAAGYVNQGLLPQKYRYIIIDEFQDISIGRYGLIKALKNANPACRLFCVGDDWQSIYRFTGSDLTLFKNFSTHFGYSETAKIESTYRFSAPLIDMSGEFIQRNPNQARKQLKGLATKKTNWKIVYSDSDETDDTNALEAIFSELAQLEGIENKSVMVLGRYTFDIKRVKNSQCFNVNPETGFIHYNGFSSTRHPTRIEAEFKTVHRSKGLEADIVIVLNCNSGKLGFPSQLSDDPILNLLLSTADQFENGEERRLFYVAMTRAKEQLFLVAGATMKSKFITELETGRVATKSVKCSKCKNADMLMRKQGVAKNGNKYKFYGCSNYSYGCENTKMVWENKLIKDFT